MLTWASLGAATGRPAQWAVEALLQTVRKTQVSSSGGERASGPGKRTFIMPGGWQESPLDTPRASSRAARPARCSGLAPGAPPVLRTAQPASQVSLSEPPCPWKLLALAKLPAHPFHGCPGQPHRGKLLAVPILNTSVMVYGPWRGNYGVQNLAFMAPPPWGALREQCVSCSQFR